MTYTLGPASTAKLATVHPRLRGVIQRTIGLTTQDFTVVQGLRTQAEAKANTAKGTSRTTHSLHLMQPDGYAHAVDLAAWISGELAYEPLSSFYLIATAVRQAARDLNVTVRWGCVWDRNLNDLSENLAMEVSAYQVRHAGSDLVDAGHFELPRGVPITTEEKA